MVLLSQMMRNAAFTGSADPVFVRIAGRQGGRWAEQTVAAAYPTARSQGDSATLHELMGLRQKRGPDRRRVRAAPRSSGRVTAAGADETSEESMYEKDGEKYFVLDTHT